MAMGRTRWSNLAIAAVVLLMVAMMVVSLPPAVLDLLLALNIAIAVALLLASLLTPNPRRFASFPTVIVLTTLFRISLGISTTRLILGHGDAGEMVRSFGVTAAGGSLVVGIVAFLLLAIAQLLVIAKGAERIAEVAARFALDAMPGKQLAIDADVRSGAIDAATAAQRRADLDRNTELLGAMDGGMRFVKGDAIAAIVIVFINLAGGLIVGIVNNGMSASQALATYSVLSIGEGLLVQIPSLTTAIAAGVLISRIASGHDQAGGIGVQIGRELFGSIEVLALSAAVLLALALAPGLPFLPFVVLAAGMVAAAGWMWSQQRPSMIMLGDHSPAVWLAMTRSEFRTMGEQGAKEELTNITRSVERRLGVCPALGWKIVNDPARRGEIAIAANTFSRPAGVDSPDYVQRICELADEWLTVDHVAAQLAALAKEQPVLVRETVPALISTRELTELCKHLVSEQVSIANLSAILVAVANMPGIDKGVSAVGPRSPAFAGSLHFGPAALLDHVRSKLRRTITAKWAPTGTLRCWTIQPMIEDAVRSGVDKNAANGSLALEPDIAADIIGAVRKAGDDVVVLAASDIRRPLRTLLEVELPNVVVLSAVELTPGTKVLASGQISVA